MPANSVACATPPPGDPSVALALRTNVPLPVYLDEVQTPTARLVSVIPGGTAGGGWLLQPYFSTDGRTCCSSTPRRTSPLATNNPTADPFKVRSPRWRRSVAGDPAQPQHPPGATAVERRAGKTHAIEYADWLGTARARRPGGLTSGTPVAVALAASARRLFRVREAPRVRRSGSLVAGKNLGAYPDVAGCMTGMPSRRKRRRPPLRSG